jgi:hypothetical protein
LRAAWTTSRRLIFEMWLNSGVIDLFINQELTRCLGSESSDVRFRLADAAKRLFRHQISNEDAHQAFSAYPSALPVVKYVQQIVYMSDCPLPASFGRDPLAAASRRKSFPWTSAEDLRLLAAVARFGARDWRAISSFVGAGRTASQCNQRWYRAIDPTITHRAWDSEEDRRLLSAVETYGTTSWCRVARVVVARTDLQCRYRYLQLVKSSPSSEDSETAEPQSPRADNKKQHAEMTWDGIEPMLPYYLDSSLTPRTDPEQQCLHRLPPLICPRSPRATQFLSPSENRIDCTIGDCFSALVAPTRLW